MANEKRLIDANRLIAELRKSAEYHEKRRLGYYSAIDHIREQPTVDAVEVKHGRWIWKDRKCFCSACSKQGEPKQVYQDGTVDEYPYCPNCGAKMDGDGNA